MLIKNYNTTSCINGCTLFNDKSNYEYWENRTVTTDELEVINYLNKFYSNKKLSILHIGIGNSYVARKINFFSKVDGITVSQNEIKKGNQFEILKYKIFYINKFEKNVFKKNKLNNYDIIIDVNLKSYSCCGLSFENLIKDYSNMLNKKGIIITGKKGMNWSRLLKPVFAFSFKKFIYKKLKEFDGPKTNILSIDDCNKFCFKNKLKINYEDNNLLVFRKYE